MTDFEVEYEQAVRAAEKHGVDDWKMASAMATFLGHPSKVARVLWAAFRRGDLQVPERSHLWSNMAIGETFTGQDLADLLAAVAASEPCTSGQMHWGLFEGCDDHLTQLIRAKADDLGSVIACWRGLGSPMDQGVAFALALAGALPPAELPEGTVDGVAWGIADNNIWGDLEAEVRPLFDRATLAEAVARAVVNEGSSWRVRSVLPYLDALRPEGLAAMLLDLEGREYSQGLFDALEAQAPALEPYLKARAEALLDQSERPPWTCAVIVLGLPSLPDRYDPILRRALRRIVRAGDVARTQAALRALDPDRLERLLLPEAGDGLAWWYVPLRPTAAVAATAVAAIGRERLREQHRLAFRALGGRATEGLIAALKAEGLASAESERWAGLLAEIGDPAALEALIWLLGSSRKGPREAARQAIGAIGAEHPDAAADALVAALAARKKTIRVAAAQSLSALPRTERVVEIARAARAAARDDEVSEALAPLCSEPERLPDGLRLWRELKAQADEQAVDAIVQELASDGGGFRNRAADLDPALALVGAGRWLIGEVSTTRWFASWGWRDFFAQLAETPVGAAVPWVLLEALAGTSDTSVANHAAELLEGGSMARGGVEAVTWTLANNPPQKKAPIFSWWVRRLPATPDEPATELLLGALGDPSKEVRTRAGEVLVRAGAAVLDRLHPLLEAKRQATRLAAAEVIAEIGAPESLPVVEARLAKERSAKVKTALLATLALARPVLVGGEPETADADAGIEQRMADLAPPELPKGLGVLPPPRWKTGAVWSEPATRWLVNALRADDPEAPDPMLATLRARIDDPSAQALGRALRDARDDRWVVYAQGLFGEPAFFDKHGPHLDDQARGGQFVRAGYLLEAMRRAASPAAIRWIDHWSRKARSTGLRDRALQARAALAKRLGISEGALAERVLGAQGFDPTGRRSLAYGDRTLTLVLEAEGAVGIFDGERRLRALPKARKGEDGAAVAATKREVAAMRKALKADFAAQTARLEEAMVSGRVWAAADFQRLFHQHPIGAALGRGLVFEALGGSRFVLDAAGSPLGSDGGPVKLQPAAHVRLPHPVEMTESEREAFLDRLTERGARQPFRQLQRRTWTYREGLLEGLLRGADPIEPRRLASGLRRLGYHLDGAEDAGMVYGATRRFGEGWSVHIGHQGHYAAAGEWSEGASAIESVTFQREGKPMAAQAAPAAVFSEAVADLAHLGAVSL